MKRRCVFLCLGLLAGCAAVQPPAPPSSILSTTSIADLRAQAYQAGMEAVLRAYGEHYLDNDFPYYNWSPPLVQRVWVPASIQGGVFIPGHMAEVIIKPGAWKREFAAPLSTRTSPADARPHSHDRPVGWADSLPYAGREPRTAAPLASDHPASAGSVAIPWEPLPPPDEEWITDK